MVSMSLKKMFHSKREATGAEAQMLPVKRHSKLRKAIASLRRRSVSGKPETILDPDYPQTGLPIHPSQTGTIIHRPRAATREGGSQAIVKAPTLFDNVSTEDEVASRRSISDPTTLVNSSSTVDTPGKDATNSGASSAPHSSSMIELSLHNQELEEVASEAAAIIAQQNVAHNDRIAAIKAAHEEEFSGLREHYQYRLKDLRKTFDRLMYEGAPLEAREKIVEQGRQIEALRRDNFRLRQERHAMSSEVHKLDGRLNSKQRLSRKDGILFVFQEKLTEVKEQLSDTEASQQRLKEDARRAKSLRKQFAAVKGDLVGANEQVADKEMKLREATTLRLLEVELLSDELNAAKTGLQAVREKVVKKEATIKQLESNCQTQKTLRKERSCHLLDANDETAALKKELVDAIAANGKLKSQLQQYETSRRAAEADLGALKGVQAAWVSYHANITNELKPAVAGIEGLSTNYTDAVNIRTLYHAHLSLRDQLASAVADNANLRGEVVALHGRHDEFSRERSFTQKELEALAEEKRKLREAIQALEGRLAETKMVRFRPGERADESGSSSRVSSSSLRLQRLEQRNLSLEDTNAALTAQLSAVVNALNVSSIEDQDHTLTPADRVRALHTSITNAHTTINALHAERDEACNEVQGHNSYAEDVRTAYKGLDSEHDALKVSHQRLVGYLEEAQKERDGAATQNKLLYQQLEQGRQHRQGLVSQLHRFAANNCDQAALLNLGRRDEFYVRIMQENRNNEGAALQHQQELLIAHQQTNVSLGWAQDLQKEAVQSSTTIAMLREMIGERNAEIAKHRECKFCPIAPGVIFDDEADAQYGEVPEFAL